MSHPNIVIIIGHGDCCIAHRVFSGAQWGTGFGWHEVLGINSNEMFGAVYRGSET